jgi:BolA family transcriptional regulator, general stress-responsive regulator
MSTESLLRERLMVALTPSRLDVVNQSHMHAGHASSPNNGESHYDVLVVADAFKGRTRLERHRLVNDAAADLLKGRIHALAIKAYAPGELLG